VSDELKVSLGVREDGKVVHITEIDAQTERGLACRCTCAECGDQLVARLGKVRQRHFAHHTSRDCVTSDESALHRFAKEVFLRNSTFKVPEARVWMDSETASLVSKRHAEEHHSFEFSIALVSECVAPAGYVEYAEAVLERAVNEKLRPDVTLMRPSGEPPLLVEVRVTHAVDEAKEAVLKALGLPCIEVDLSALHVGLDSFDREGIERMLIYGDAEKYWVCVPGEATHVAALKERVLLEEEQYRLEDERKKLEEEERLRIEREKQHWLARTEDERRTKQERLLSAESIKAVQERKGAELATHPMWLRNARILGVDGGCIPYYVNEKVKGEYLFTVPRTVWQSSLFLSWVFNKQDPTRSRIISVKCAVDNLHQQHPEFWEKALFWAHRDRHDVLDPATVVGDYFLFLRDLGFIEEDYGRSSRPLTWKFKCVMPRVAPIPSECNSKRYLPRVDGVFDTQTKQHITLPLGGVSSADTAPNP